MRARPGHQTRRGQGACDRTEKEVDVKKWLTVLGVIAVCGFSARSALATGTLADNGALVLSFNDQTGQTMITGTNDGTFIWTASGGSNTGNRLARYNQDGSVNQIYAPGIDFRCLYIGAGNQLYAKEFCGATYAISQNGVPTPICAVSDPDCQSKGGLSAGYSSLYLRSSSTVYEFNAANCASQGSFALSGMNINENNYPEMIQLAVAPGGRLLTFADGVVSEWPVGGGSRIGTCNLAINSPTDFDTNFSFGVGADNRVYVWDAGRGLWTVWDIGLGGQTPVAAQTWGKLKSIYR